ncbi:AaceriAEL055Cp [[Ashbya] aceris (nom. inval.)]|nr:AaceriAEL055Cp [[Ashbya] aceris (nom. inval.)]
MKVSDQIAVALKQHGIEVVFGIVGIPIVELAEKLSEHGIRFIACRNEQSCSYAASVYGYLKNKPGALLVVGGSGVVHALAGIHNAWVNKWPLLVIAGSTEDEYKGGFQELDQLRIVSPWTSFQGRLSLDNVNYMVYTAVKTALLQQGVSYLDVPGRLINMDAAGPLVSKPVEIQRVRSGPDSSRVHEAAKLLQNGKNVLVVVGRGCAEYPTAVRKFVERYKLPFLPVPMAKGIVPDSHELNVNGCRSLALKRAEVILVLGARLNWILHYGSAPKWNADATFIQVDRDPATLGHNNSRGVNYSVLSDVELFIDAITTVLPQSWQYRGVDEEVLDKIRENGVKLQRRAQIAPGSPLNYHAVYSVLRKLIDDKNTILSAEGANTMDNSRLWFGTDYPKRRLDAGTGATMGLGIGYAMSAKLAHPDKFVVALEGDSAFGFSCMELETAVRNKVGLVVVVMNNGGIYHGNPGNGPVRTTDLSPECSYHLVGQGLGCHGALVRTLDELKKEFPQALQNSMKNITTVLNVILEPGTQTNVSFGWQAKSNM